MLEVHIINHTVTYIDFPCLIISDASLSNQSQQTALVH